MEKKFIKYLLFSSCFFLLITIGVFLRLWYISGQIAMDDELHAVYAICRYSYTYIFSHFFHADICAPLALVYKVIADTIGLNEINFRLPSLFFGISLLISLPLLLSRYINYSSLLFFTALIAISPLLIYFSRFARPYAIMAFFGPIACISQYHFVRSGKMKWGVIYILVSTISIYLHILSAVFVGSPLLIAFIIQVIRAKKKQDNYLYGIILQGVAIFVILSFLYIPPFIESYQVLFEKGGKGCVKLKTLTIGAQLISGTKESILVTIFLLLIVTGGGILFRRNKILTLFLTIPCILQFTIIILTGADLVGVPIVFIRYCIQALPIFLLFAAITISTLVFASLRKGFFLFLITTVFFITYVVLLYVYGPMPHLYQYPNNFTNLSQAQGNYNDIFFQKKIPYPVSKFYYMLNEMDGQFSIIEAPWYYQFFNLKFHTYQKIHKKEIMIGLVNAYTKRYTFEVELNNKKKFAFKRFIPLNDPEQIEKCGARFLIVHNNLSKEVNFTQRPPIDSIPIINSMKERYGSPIFIDEDLTVFDLTMNNKK